MSGSVAPEQVVPGLMRGSAIRRASSTQPGVLLADLVDSAPGPGKVRGELLFDVVERIGQANALGLGVSARRS
jgi:hypothetical protein